MAKKSTKNKELVKVLSGKATEPKYTGFECGMLDLIRGLNHYAKFSKPDQMKEWSLEWLLRENQTALLNRVSGFPTSFFMTFGALSRMALRGFQHDTQTIERMLEYFRSANPANSKMIGEEPSEPVAIEPKKRGRKKKPQDFTVLDNLDAAIDAIMNGETPKPFEVDQKDKNLVKDQCRSILQDMTNNPDDYRAKTLKALTKFLLGMISSTKSAVKVNVKAPKTRSKRATPASIVKGVKFLKEDAETGLKSINPMDVLERRKMYVYDAQKRRLIMYVSTGPGFHFTGTTLHNVDMKKSSWKTVRKPERDLKGKKLAIYDLNKLFESLTTKETPITATRFNQHCVILNVTAKGQ